MMYHNEFNGTINLHKYLTAIILAILLFAVPDNLQAERLNADKILREISKHFSAEPYWQIEFKHTFVWTLAIDSTSQDGVFIIGPGNSFRLDSGVSHILSDGKNLWRWDDGTDQVLLEDLQSSEDVILPQQMLVRLEEKFKPGKVEKKDRDSAVVALSPRNGSEFMQQIVLGLVKEEKVWLPANFAFKDIGDNQNFYQVLQRLSWTADNVPQEISNALDPAAVPAGMQLIDLR
jgi:hypothetical protein